MQQATAAGAGACGRFMRSLLDNFEYVSGYLQGFGIVYGDFGTQRRIPKASAR